ncbi:MAG: SpaH/EbpB family LPXTG-anchored major pilin [Lachnospiraceae bacterium]|nr:SpaH/EbpB family LPXTG-anchored major pilin [Lachnospiraceae bacterium]
MIMDRGFRKKRLWKIAGRGILFAVLAMIPAACVMAAPEDVIDTSERASLTIHKYDMTAASDDGIDVTRFTSNGERDADAERTLRNYVIEGVEFTYVRVGGINTDQVDGKIKLLYDIPVQLENILGLGDSHGGHRHTSDELERGLKSILADNTAGKNALEKYIRSASGRTAMTLTDENGVTEATGLPLGLYLLTETQVPANVYTTVDPFFISLPMTDSSGDYWMYDVDVYPKNQTNIPDLDKLVRQEDDAALYNRPEYGDTATASEGDRVDYIFVSHLPRITSEATYLTEYKFVDKMDKGITYNRDAAVYFYSNEADARANNTKKAAKVWGHGSSAFQEIYDGSNSDYHQMTIAPTRDGLKEINPGLSGYWIVVAYSGTVNSDATPVLGDAGNTNDVKLTWKRTSMEFSDTLEDRSRVYTFGINLKKEFRDASKAGDPTKVQFVLQNQTDGYYVTARKKSSGLYYVTDETKGAEEANGTVFSPAADGALVINGLEADTYILTEIQTSDGYSLLKEPITIQITCTEDTFLPSRTTLYDIADIRDNPHKKMIEAAGQRASAVVDGKTVNMSTDIVKNVRSANARVDMSVINTPGFTLPRTGGTGTLLFTLAGCAVALLGIVIATKKPKKPGER